MLNGFNNYKTISITHNRDMDIIIHNIKLMKLF
jgi:hypothetical protein